jgi:hypothetical protein
VTTQVEIVFVAPKDRGTCFDDGFGEHIMKIDNLETKFEGNNSIRGELFEIK